MEKTIGEASNNEVTLANGDYLEMVFVLSEAGHKEHVDKILARTRPEERILIITRRRSLKYPESMIHHLDVDAVCSLQ